MLQQLIRRTDLNYVVIGNSSLEVPSYVYIGIKKSEDLVLNENEFVSHDFKDLDWSDVHNIWDCDDAGRRNLNSASEFKVILNSGSCWLETTGWQLDKMISGFDTKMFMFPMIAEIKDSVILIQQSKNPEDMIGTHLAESLQDKFDEETTEVWVLNSDGSILKSNLEYILDCLGDQLG